MSRDIFDQANSSLTQARPYNQIFISIGRRGDLTSKVRESLVSIGRLLLFVSNEVEGEKWPKDQRAHLKGMQRDVGSLSDHATYLSNKIQFLLDAVLGVVSLQQNNIIKIFSVAAVVFMPPTLVASIYGMNFKHMPRTRMGIRLPVRHPADDRGGGASVFLLQVEEVALAGFLVIARSAATKQSRSGTLT